jgi:hypothetical protein
MGGVLYVIHVMGPDGASLEGALISAESKNGPWKGLTDACGFFMPFLGDGHYDVTISAPGFEPRTLSWDLASSGLPIQVQLEKKAPGPTPPQPGNLTLLKGATCIPDFFDENVGPHRNLWTPAFLAKEYRDRWPEIVAKYKARGYDTMEIIACGMPYHNDYSEIFPDTGLLQEGLTYLREAGLKTVTTLMDDRRGDDLSYVKPLTEAAGDLMDWAMPMYEMNAAMFGRMVVDSWDGAKWQGGLTEALINCKRILPPHVKVGLHMTADHGSIGSPEAEWWRYASGNPMQMGGQSPVGRFIDASLYQCSLPDLANLHESALSQGKGLEDVAIRYAGTHPAWKGSDCATNLFEVHTSYTYRNQMTETQARDYCDTMISQGPTVAKSGYMDGGR